MKNKISFNKNLISKVLCAECNEEIDFKGCVFYLHKIHDKYNYPLCEECWEWIDEEQEKDEKFKPDFVVEEE